MVTGMTATEGTVKFFSPGSLRSNAAPPARRVVCSGDIVIMRGLIQWISTNESSTSSRRAPLTENGIQAADDEYFERRNLYGGWTDRP